MPTVRRPFPIVVCGAALGFVLLGAVATARASDTPPDLRTPAKVSARLEEGALIPGQAGTLIVTFSLGDARTRIQVGNLDWKIVESGGSQIDLDAQTRRPAPVQHTNESGVVERYNEGTFDVRIPVRRLADSPDDAAIVLEVRQILCHSTLCGMKLRPDTIRVPLTKAKPASRGAPLVGPARPVTRGGATVGVTLLDDPSRIRVRFAPALGHHLYLPPKGEDGIPIAIGVSGGAGVRFGEVRLPEGAKFTAPIEIDIPVEVEATAEGFTVTASWQACKTLGNCLLPVSESFVFARPPAAGDDTPVPPVEAGPDPADPDVGAIAFPVRSGDEFEGGVPKESLVQRKLREGGLLLTLLSVFLVGAGLTFTPCVFPIIPLVVATIAGGKSIARRRLLSLLAVYVLALSLTFATIGVVAAFTGASMQAAFESTWFIGAMAAFFIVLAFGMLGLFELQPPQWLMRLQGGAQSRGGSFVGAFLLGVLGAVLASPCTGPVIVGMAATIAQSKDAVLGFELFFSFGLGMGAVIALFGMANLALRPGPWMVWVRYVFGVLLFGGATFYVANSALLPRTWLWVLGIGVAALAGALLAWHVVRREREPKAVGMSRGAIVMGLFVAALSFVMYVNRPAGGLPWTVVRDLDRLKAEIADATASGQPVIVDVWANWCPKCKEYDHVMAGDADLQARLRGWKRLKIDLSDDTKQYALRDAIGAPREAAPFLVFFDRKGILWTGASAFWLGEADGEGSENERAANRLRERLIRVGA